MRYLLFLSSSILLLTQLNSQNLKTWHSPYSWIYKLNDYQIRQLVEKPYLSRRNFTSGQPIDSVRYGERYDWEKASPGTYIQILIINNQISHRIHVQTDFESPQAFSSRKKTWLLIRHATYPVDQLKLKINDQPVAYDAASQSFKLDKRLKKGLIEVRSPDEIQFYDLEQILNKEQTQINYLVNSNQTSPTQSRLGRLSGKKKKYKRKLRYPEPEKYEDFLATNKPIYKAGDTVRIKGFVLDETGKAVRASADLYLGPYGESVLSSDRIQKLKTLDPVSPGAYVYDYILPDSLKLDRRYNLILASSDSVIMVRNDFYLEEYLLDEVSYDLQVKSRHKKGDSLMVIASGTDANGLPIQDGWVKLSLHFRYLNDTLREEGYIPLLLYEEELPLNRTGRTSIYIPDSLLPDESIHYELKATFSNAANESQTLTRPFRVVPSWVDSVKLPVPEQVQQLASQTSIPEARAFRRNDSILFTILNPDSSTVLYEIYQGNKLIDQGVTKTDWQWYSADSDDWPYRLEYFFENFSYIARRMEILPPIRKLLNITVSQPEKITPGETATTEITVTDSEGHPVAGVNLTAFGLNAQFRKDNVPQVPYLVDFPILRSDYYTNKLEKVVEGDSRDTPVKPVDLVRYRMANDTYFKLSFPDSIFIYEHPIESDKAMFAPFVYKNGKQEKVRLIWMENGLVYYSRTEGLQPYAFVADSGLHDIWVRTNGAEYKIKDVLLKPGIKTEISIHPDHESSRVERKEMSPYFTELEAMAINRSMIEIQLSSKPNDTYVWQDDRVHVVENGLRLIGPFKKGKMNYLKKGHFGRTFDFRSGYRFEIRRDGITETGISGVKTGAPFPYEYTHGKPSQDFGEIVLLPEDIKYSNQPVLGKSKTFFELGVDDAEQHGNLFLKLGEEIKPARIFFWNTSDKEHIFQVSETYYIREQIQLAALPAGEYQFLFKDRFGNFFKPEPILIRPQQLFYSKISTANFTADTLWARRTESLHQITQKGLFYAQILKRGSISISGKITNQQKPDFIVGAEVLLFHGNDFVTAAYSNEKGDFKFEGIEPGKYLLHFLHPSFSHRVDTLQLDNDVKLDIPLTVYPKPIPSEWQEALKAPHSIHPVTDRYDRRFADYTLSYSKVFPELYGDDIFYQNPNDQEERRFRISTEGIIYQRATDVQEIYGSRRTNKKSENIPFQLGDEWTYSIWGGTSWLTSELHGRPGRAFGFDLMNQSEYRWGLGISLGWNRTYGWGNVLRTSDYPDSPWSNYSSEGFYPNYQLKVMHGLLEGEVRLIDDYDADSWNGFFRLGLGGIMSSISANARNGTEPYDFGQLNASPFQDNQNLRKELYQLWDEDYETQIRKWGQGVSPLVSAGLGISVWSWLGFQFQFTYKAMWTPFQSLDGGGWRKQPHIFQQVSLGVVWGFWTGRRPNRKMKAKWYANPGGAIYRVGRATTHPSRPVQSRVAHIAVPESESRNYANFKSYQKLPSPRFGDDSWTPKNDSTSLDAYQARISELYKEYNSMASVDPAYQDANYVRSLREEMERLRTEAILMRDKLQFGSALRSTFRDYAYWQPNLITDANGKASFTTTFPDDITGWETHVLAINENKQSGYAKGKIQAWKPLSGRLALPSFVLEGDSASAIGRAISYEEDSVEVNSRFQINDETPTESTLQFLGSASENLPFSFADTGTYSLTYTIETASAYQDGEKREIEVLPVGVVEKKGQFLYVDKDTSLMLDFDPKDGPIHLIAQVHPLGQLLERLEYLKDYPYDCNEQAASKLIALLSERQIRQALDQAFENENQIRKLVRRLQNAQNKDGSWGWWRGNQAHVWMTAHVSRALLMAEPTNKSAQKGLVYLKNHWQDDTQQSQIALHIWLQLLESGIDDPEMEIQFISTFASKSGEISFYEQLMLTRIRQLRGLSYDPAYLQSSYQETATGGNYWGESGWQWYGHQIEMSLLAYQILRDKNPTDVLLPRIRQYFLAYPHYNTAELAQMLAVIVPDMIQAGMPADLDPKLEIRYGTQVLNFAQFPNEANIPQGSSTQIQIRKSGGAPAYLTAYQTQFIRQPAAVDSLFAVRSWLEQDNKTVDSLRTGSAADLWIELTAKKSADHLALEVPIPAGCVYGEKIQPPGEAHREYRKHMTTLFLEYLPEGTRRFCIPLEVRYAGSYTLNPAKVELMYVPVRFGRNELRRVGIR